MRGPRTDLAPGTPARCDSVRAEWAGTVSFERLRHSCHRRAGRRPGDPDMRILCRWRVLPEHPAWVVDFAVVATDPASRGRVGLVSADPLQPPRIDPGYLTAPADADVLRRGVELARAIAATASCRAAGIGAEVLPGAGRALEHI